MKIRHCGQLILLVVFASLLSVNALAQDESEASSPLEIKLTARTTAFCVGSPLVLEMEIRNNGQADILIHKSNVWEQFSYSYVEPNGKNRSGGRNWGRRTGAGTEGNLILHPGESYYTTYEFSLSADFFQTAGHYTLKTNLNHVSSNEVEFELYDCGKPQEVKEQ